MAPWQGSDGGLCLAKGVSEHIWVCQICCRFPFCVAFKGKQKEHHGCFFHLFCFPLGLRGGGGGAGGEGAIFLHKDPPMSPFLPTQDVLARASPKAPEGAAFCMPRLFCERGTAHRRARRAGVFRGVRRLGGFGDDGRLSGSLAQE